MVIARLLLVTAAVIALAAAPVRGQSSRISVGTTDAAALASSVTIHRDAWGVPHIDGPTDKSVLFGFAYAQAEDYFWQVEDSYILALGRYSEVHGGQGLNSDLLNRAFQIVPEAQADYERLDPELKSLFSAFASGLNYYLQRHREVRPRLIRRFEPWQILALGRHLMLEMTFRYTRLSQNYLPRTNPEVLAATGSNAWAIAPARARDGHALLLANPHQPWFGFGQFYEAHLRSGEGWSFTGATFFGCPLPSLGHNEHLGWSYTTNEPDIADVWRETFDDPQHPLRYRYGDGYRTATEWQERIKVRTKSGLAERVCTFRKTHHGPLVAREEDGRYLAARIAILDDVVMLRQLLKLVRARNLEEFRQGLALQEFPLMNIVYANRRGNIWYLYNGAVPRRDPRFDWSQPVDGSDPRTEWQGLHPLEDLPQVLNPESGYVQNCNSTPFTTCEQGSPLRESFPPYMVEDRDDDKRRAQLSRQLLAAMHQQTFEGLQRAAFDTTLHWPQQELPRLAGEFALVEAADPLLAGQAAPLWKHLLNWDCRVTHDSTQATLCLAWHQELYGAAYPGERLKPQFVDNPVEVFQALVRAGAGLQALYGDWRVPWGQVHRIQRHANVADLLDVPFDDALPSLPSLAAPGQLGVVLTSYYKPALSLPFGEPVKNRYGLVGTTWLGVFEFGERVRGATLVQFGASGDPASPHYFDQARLLSEGRLKPELFHWEDVLAGAERSYHPGEE